MGSSIYTRDNVKLAPMKPKSHSHTMSQFISMFSGATINRTMVVAWNRPF